MEFKDYYQTLGIEKTATAADKKAAPAPAAEAPAKK